ncbi:MAG: hypothetical protein FWF88_09325 [Peptococcaceae bacterium]|nr:hypothetical protein [Peptococcaceae bacterium]
MITQIARRGYPFPLANEFCSDSSHNNFLKKPVTSDEQCSGEEYAYSYWNQLIVCCGQIGAHRLLGVNGGKGGRQGVRPALSHLAVHEIVQGVCLMSKFFLYFFQVSFFGKGCGGEGEEANQSESEKGALTQA